jgi:hypothetical protein
LVSKKYKAPGQNSQLLFYKKTGCNFVESDRETQYLVVQKISPSSAKD